MSGDMQTLFSVGCVALTIGFAMWGYWVGKMDERDWWRKELVKRGVLYEAQDKDHKALYWRNGHDKAPTP